MAKRFHVALFAAGAVLLGLGFAAAASAQSVTITDVEGAYSDNAGIVALGGPYTSLNPWTTPILMTDTDGDTYLVFCDDLDHDVNVGGGQKLPYELGDVTENGLGVSISEAVSNEMGQVADLGDTDYLDGNKDGAIAAQAAIWGIEYGIPVSSSNSTIESDITEDLKVKDNGEGWALGLIAEGGTQSEIIGLGSSTTQGFIVGGVPEPGAWAMMLLGVGAVGATLRRGRRKRLSAVA